MVSQEANSKELGSLRGQLEASNATNQAEKDTASAQQLALEENVAAEWAIEDSLIAQVAELHNSVASLQGSLREQSPDPL